jgi:hypothetical protein
MTDFLEVKAKRTFALGKELKTKKSDPFPLESGEARQLEASGLVDIVGKTKVDEVPETEVSETEPTEPTEPIVEPEPEPAPRKPRKAKADADN